MRIIIESSKDVSSIQKWVDEMNNSMDTMRNKKIEVRKEDLPSNLSLMIPGIENIPALNLLFSSRLDVLIEKLLGMILSGDFEKILKSEDSLRTFLKSSGIGDGAFEGPVSRNVIASVQSSVNSIKFARTKSKMGQALLVLGNLKSHAKTIKDKTERKKYDEAVYAIERVMRMVSLVYKNRQIINDKVYRGLKNIVKEGSEVEEAVQKLYE
jgi:hypothetical protein